MKVLFDGAAFILQSRGGVSRVLLEIFTYVSTTDGVDCCLFAGFHCNQFIRNAPHTVKKKIIGWYVPESLAKQRIFVPINHILFAALARCFSPDICHLTYFDIPPLPKKSKVVVTVHDMIRELFYADKAYWKYARKSDAIARADGVICISKHTHKDLSRFCSLEGKHTAVIYHGNSLDNMEGSEVSAPYSYMLYVGRRDMYYKNFDIILQALAKLWNCELSLVCFGGGPLTVEEMVRIKELGLEGRVLQCGGSDTMLVGYYKAAVALIYPSKYEGFGLPPIEAMSHGCPVISSNAPPMPEIIVDAALFFDPTDVDQLAECMVKVQDKRMRESLVQDGHQRAASFSWRKSAEQTVCLYESLIPDDVRSVKREY